MESSLNPNCGTAEVKHKAASIGKRMQLVVASA